MLRWFEFYHRPLQGGGAGAAAKPFGSNSSGIIVRQVWPAFRRHAHRRLFRRYRSNWRCSPFSASSSIWRATAATPDGFLRGARQHADLDGRRRAAAASDRVRAACRSSVNQVIAANFTNLIRWQTHRYVLRQSLSFFQNDFAGRIANKIMQTGPSLRQTMVQVADALVVRRHLHGRRHRAVRGGGCPADRAAADLAGGLCRLHDLFRAAAEGALAPSCRRRARR